MRALKNRDENPWGAMAQGWLRWFVAEDEELLSGSHLTETAALRHAEFMRKVGPDHCYSVVGPVLIPLPQAERAAPEQPREWANSSTLEECSPHKALA